MELVKPRGSFPHLNPVLLNITSLIRTITCDFSVQAQLRTLSIPAARAGPGAGAYLKRFLGRRPPIEAVAGVSDQPLAAVQPGGFLTRTRLYLPWLRLAASSPSLNLASSTPFEALKSLMTPLVAPGRCSRVVSEAVRPSGVEEV